MGIRAWFLACIRRAAAFFERDEQAAALREEMRLHVELRARKLHWQGLDADEAAYAARRQFGSGGGQCGNASFRICATEREHWRVNPIVALRDE